MCVSRSRLCLAGILVLLLAPALALQVAPATFETELTVEQQHELIQALVANNIQPPRRLIVIDPRPPRPFTVHLIVREDEPGEIGPLAVVVAGDTVQDADVLRLDGDGDFSGPPLSFQFSWGSAVVVQGTPSSSLPLLLRIVLDLERR